MKIFYVINARLPSKKAHGIQATQTCQAFIEAGVNLVLVIPRTRVATQTPSLKEFYRLRVDVPTVMLPALDWYDRGRVGFIASSLSFMVTSFFYLLSLRMRGAIDAIYTVDTNTFSLAFLPLTGIPCFAEIHVTKPKNFANRLFFRNARGIITLNTKVRDELMTTFGLPVERFIVEPCGVEASWFEEHISQEAARKKLSIPENTRMVTYVGRLYSWKGLDILPKAFALIPTIDCYIVGGSKEEFIAATGVRDIPPNIRIMGACPHYEVPLWHAAANAFVVPWPKNQLAYHEYGSPMKLFECMAAKRPLVSADHITITCVVPRSAALLYKPGDATDLAQAIERAFAENTGSMVERAYETAKKYTLPNRAIRTKAFIKSRLS